MGSILYGFAFGYGVLAGIGNHLSRIFLILWLTLAGTVAATAEPLRIAALGDSLTQGYGLLQQDGFTAQLENWLVAQGRDVEVLNAGVSGDTTAGGLARIEWTLSPRVDALIVALGGNDVLRGLPPEQARANLTAIMEAAKAQGLPVLIAGIAVPANYGAAYQRDFLSIYPDLARAYDAVLVDNFLGPLMAKAETGEDLSAYIQPDGLHPNEAGVKVIVEGWGPKVIELLDRIGG